MKKVWFYVLQIIFRDSYKVLYILIYWINCSSNHFDLNQYKFIFFKIKKLIFGCNICINLLKIHFFLLMYWYDMSCTLVFISLYVSETHISFHISLYFFCSRARPSSASERHPSSANKQLDQDGRTLVGYKPRRS